ncbi:hypothetical protein Tco_1581161, partial [Tanacetum coccineum]
YNDVPSPHPLILNRPTPLDLSYSGPRHSSVKPTTGCDKESDNSKENTDDSLKQQQKTDSKTSSVKSSLKVDKDWKEKFFCLANHVRKEESKKARKNNDAPIIDDWVSDDEDDEDDVEPIPKVEKISVIPTATKKEFVKPKKPVRRSVRAFFICGSFDHIQYSCPKTSHKHMAPKAVLMKTGLRSFNTVRPSYTAHPKSTVHCARPRIYFQNQAQSTIHRPFYKRTSLTKRSYNQNVNTGGQNVNTIRARGFNASNLQLNGKGFVDSGCSRHMTGNITHLFDFKDFDGGYVTFGGGAYGGRITGKGTIKTDNLDFDDVYFVKELNFNLYVLFTDTECLVLSPNFKLPDEN